MKGGVNPANRFNMLMFGFRNPGCRNSYTCILQKLIVQKKKKKKWLELSVLILRGESESHGQKGSSVFTHVVFS